jgi:carboxypeptidase family protein
MTQRTPKLGTVTLWVLFTLAPPPQAQATGFVTPGPPQQRLWIRDALTGVGIAQARARAVGNAASLTVQAWADPTGRLRLFPSARTERIEIFAAGYQSKTIAPASIPTQTTTVWLMPMRWPQALQPQVITARRLPDTALLHGHVVDGGTGRPLRGALVVLAGTDIRTTTNEYGYFLLYATAARDASADLIISAPGYVSSRLAHIALSEGDSLYIVDLERGSGESLALPGSRRSVGH